MFYRHNVIRSWFHRVVGILMVAFIIPIVTAGSAKAQSWTKIRAFDGYISLVKFLDVNTGFVALGIAPGKPVTGPSPVELDKTTDGGKTWITCSIPSGYGGEIAEILMVDSLNGWIAMAAYGGSGNSALWHTTDAGLSWNETSLTGCGSAVRITPSAMTVTDVIGNGHTSTDGGNTFSDGFLNSTNCVDFVDPMHGVITDYRGANWLNSSDGGLTWQNLNLGVESWSIYADTGTSNFYAAPEGNTLGQPRHLIVYSSTDYGNTWDQLANFPWYSSGHLTGLGNQYLFCQVQDSQTVNGVAYGGFYYSTDKGVSWTSIGGPSAFGDTRFSVINACSGVILYGFNDQSPGSLFQYSFGSDSDSPGALSLSELSQNFVQKICSQPVDTAIPMAVTGCLLASASLDSLWLTGSSAFKIADARTSPRTLAAVDSILVSYLGTLGLSDTAELHIQYNLGSGLKDTTIQLTGSVTSPFLTQPAQIHREAASAYFGQMDTLTLGVDISSEINLDSLWPYVTEIKATYSWDSSVATFDEYNPPSGWTLNALTNHGNAVDFDIQNSGSTPTQPMDLGTALFRPHTNKLATTWVELPTFVIDVGSQSLSLCVTDNEDNHWAVKTLGELSGVAPLTQPLPPGGEELLVYPNPTSNELFVQNTNESPASVTIYDEIGREVASANVEASSTSSINMEPFPSGAYFLVCHIAGRTETKCITKE